MKKYFVIDDLCDGTLVKADQETVRKILGYWQSDVWEEYSIELMDAVADLRELARILGIEKEEQNVAECETRNT